MKQKVFLLFIFWCILFSTHAAVSILFSHEVTHLLLTEKQPTDTLLRGGNLSEAFQPRYPESGFETASVKLYEMSYPAECEKRPEYLLRSPRVEGHVRSE